MLALPVYAGIINQPIIYDYYYASILDAGLHITTCMHTHTHSLMQRIKQSNSYRYNTKTSKIKLSKENDVGQNQIN